MKNYFLIAAAFVAIVLSSCNETPYINAPGDNDYNYPEIPTLVPDTDGIVISVDSAYNLGSKLREDEKSDKAYKLTGKVTRMLTNAQDITSGKYSTISFYISDGGQHEVEGYLTNNIGNKPFHDPADIPAVGAEVTVQGRLTKYGTIIELTESYLVRVTPPAGN